MLVQIAQACPLVEGPRHDNVADLAFLPDALLHFVQLVCCLFVVLAPQLTQNLGCPKILCFRRSAVQRGHCKECCHKLRS